MILRKLTLEKFVSHIDDPFQINIPHYFTKALEEMISDAEEIGYTIDWMTFRADPEEIVTMRGSGATAGVHQRIGISVEAVKIE